MVIAEKHGIACQPLRQPPLTSKRVRTVEQCVGLLTTILEHQGSRLDEIEEDTVDLKALLAKQDEHLSELKRDNRQTRRIWIAIARKQELFDEDEFNDVFGE